MTTNRDKPRGWKRLARNIRRLPDNLIRPIRKWKRKRHMFRTEPLPADIDQHESFLFLAPEAMLGPHQANMAFLARVLQERGHKVYMARCFELFERCPTMNALQVPWDYTDEERRSVCSSCNQTASRFAKCFDVPSIDLRAVETAEIRKEVARAIAEAPEDLTQFNYDGVPFGGLSAVDLVLATKRYRLSELRGEDRRKWLKFIASSLKMYLLVDRLCTKANITTLVHHNDYSLLVGGKMAAAKHGIKSRAVTLAYHRNVDQGRIVIYPTYWPIYSQRLADDWPRWRNRPLSRGQIAEVIDDLIVRTSGAGTHIYSSARSNAMQAIEELGLDPGKKLIVAYTSSMDELVAGRLLTDAIGETAKPVTQPFTDQVEWLHELVAYVGRREDLQLVVRVHPREGANHREGLVSEHLPVLQAEFCSLPINCRFVWPGDKMSSYDLGEAADVATTSWSTIGVEMARFGVPVVRSFHIPEAPYPNDDFLVWGSTKDRYFERLESALTDRPSLATWARAIRWHHLANLAVSVDVSDVVEPLKEGQPWNFQMPSNDDEIEQLLQGQIDVHELNFQRNMAPETDATRHEEQLALHEQLERLMYYLARGVDRDPYAESQASQERWTVDGPIVTYQSNEETLRTRSPMLARLVRMHEDSQEALAQPTQRRSA